LLTEAIVDARAVLPEDVPALSIGTVIGGWSEAKRTWDEAFRDLDRRLLRARTGVKVPLNLNVVYQLPGEILSPDWTGVRTGSYSRKLALLMVQVAVPPGVPADPSGFIRETLSAAIDAAEAWAARRRVNADTEALRSLALAATTA
jgi:hypothetical protein